MTPGGVQIAGRDDLERLVPPIVLAFGSDPFVRWFLPDPLQYSVTFTKLVGLHAETVLDHRGAYRSDDFRSVALWYPPGVQPDGTAIGAIFAGLLGAAREEVLSSVLEQMSASKPTESHMYLRMIGVDPALQGRGHGSALMRAGLDDCDRLGLPAYLEATSVGSRVLYERHGFEVRAEIQVADAPPVWPMLRSLPTPR